MEYANVIHIKNKEMCSCEVEKKESITVFGSRKPHIRTATVLHSLNLFVLFYLQIENIEKYLNNLSLPDLSSSSSHPLLVPQYHQVCLSLIL